MATIITKNSSTASAVPAAGDLVKGELAVNVTDKKLYTKDNSAAIVKVVGSLGNQEANAVAITGGTVSGVAQTGGTINNAVIGGSTPQAVTGTTVTATTGFSGPLTGTVTGNVTGNLTGNVTGNVTGNLTGNVTASTGSSSFNNVTINGSLDMNAGSSATITGLSAPVNGSDAATKTYVDTAISGLIDSAPGTLDTLNELAAALGDDPNFAASVTTSLAGKLATAGGTMSGAIAMGTNKITGLGDPTSAQDAATKTYVDTQRDTRLALAGGTMTGNIVMGANKITSTATPTTNDDLTRKGYVDSILGSATSAAASAAAAATSETNAANSATSAASSASAAAASYDSFDDRYLGVKTSNPTLDNDGNALLTGALYFNSTASEMRVYNGTAWVAAYLPAAGYMDLTTNQTAAGVKTFSSNPILSGGTANGVAYLNGSKVLTTGSALTFDGSQFDIPAGTAAAPSLSTPTDPDTGVFFPAANQLAASVGGTEGLRLTSTGLGIGTSSPSSTLQVGGGSGLKQAIVSGGGYDLILGASGGAIFGYSSQAISTVFNTASVPLGIGTNASQPLIFGTGTFERARITSAGLFGLGVTSPQAMFDLAGNYKEGVVTANTGTAYTINTANGTLQILTLTGNCTFTFPTATAGQSFILLLKQDGTGGRTVTWPAAVKWPGSTAPTITSTASRSDKYIFTADGTNWIGSNAGQNYTL